MFLLLHNTTALCDDMSMLDQGSKLIALFLYLVINYNVYVGVIVFATWK